MATADLYATFVTNFGNITLDLFETEAPVSVANFIHYVPEYQASNNFMHRLAQSFVLQGGGYRFVNDGAQTNPTTAPIQNEYSADRPNVQGTIAWAKLGGNPNSATSQFFFNLVDNSSTLGPSNNGGFSVFGAVTGGWNVIQQIAMLPVQRFSSPFGQLPTVNYSGGDIQASNLVTFSVDVNPTILGTVGGQLAAANASIEPFKQVEIDDLDAGQIQAVTVTFTAANGTLSGGGFTGGNGVYTVSGSDAQVQAALRAAIFTPTPGQTTTTTLTISVSDGIATTVDAATSVISGASMTPTEGADFLTGAPAGGAIDGLGGNDSIRGAGGADILMGGGGDDVVDGGAGDDILDGGAALDTADYGEKAVAVVAFLNGATDIAVTVGGANEDIIRNFENLNGGSAGDTLVGDGLGNILTGNGGADFLFSNGFNPDGIMKTGAGNDTLNGGAGDDGLFGGDGADMLSGEAGKDGIVGGGGDDVLNGGAGGDFLFGGAFAADGSRLANSGADTLNGGGGNDGLYGFDGADIMHGDDGNDYVESGEGDDIANGGAGSDFVLGEAGNDTLNGGTAFDYLYGGAGADTFVFRKGDSADWILDFSTAQGDRLRFENFGFANFASIPLVDLSTPDNPAVQVTITSGGATDQLTIFGVTLAQLNAANVLVA